MSSGDHQILLQRDTLLQKGETYTGDGSVDFHGHPALNSKTGNWKACCFILGSECCERLAYFGFNTNLVNYLTENLHEGNVSAARIVTTWTGTCSLTPLIGAFLADSYWGKYWTIAVFSVTYFIGMCTLILSASIPAVKPAKCVSSVCLSATPGQYSILYVGLYLMALGIGGVKRCLPSLGADQFDDIDPIERANKGSFFQWFYFSASIGSLLASTLIVWIQENVGWGIGFTVPTLFMGIAVSTFFSGTRFYRFQKPGASPLKTIYQDIVASLFKNTPENNLAIEGSRKIEHSEGLKFLDMVASPSDAHISVGIRNIYDSQSLCTGTQVKLTILIRMFPIWITGIVYSAVYAQASTVFVEQGMVMNRSIGSFTIPAASLSMFIMISILIWVPVYDKFLMPLARNFTGNEKGFSELQRIGIGLFLSIVPMLCAAFLEIKRLKMAKELGLLNENIAVPLSISWQIPQYLLLGIADGITFVGKLEFFDDQSPDEMRSLSTAFCLLITSMGNYLSSLILTIVTFVTTSEGNPGWIPDNLNKGQLHMYFFMWASLSFLNLLVYVFFAMRYKDKKATENQGNLMIL